MQAIIDSHFYSIFKRKLHGVAVAVKGIHLDGMLHGIDNPVFTNAGYSIFKKFDKVIYSLCGRGDNFYDPVRGAVASPVLELTLITDYRDVRLNIIFAVVV